jgi:hypothetical protein
MNRAIPKSSAGALDQSSTWMESKASMILTIDFIGLLGTGVFQTEDGTWYICYPEMAVERIRDKKFLKKLEEWDGVEDSDLNELAESD